MTFQDLNLNTPLLRALEAIGFSETTTIQHKVFSVVMSGRDVCGIAQTGTGKTLAYLLPCLRQWQFDKNKNPQILILVPTRELVVQVVEAVQKLTCFMSFTAVGVYGGVNINTQQLALAKGADLIVATPGRLFDLLMNGAFKTKMIKKLVIDEMDEMLNLGFRKQITNILELLPPKRQNLLFSATITEEVEKLMNEYFNAPIRVEAAPTGTPLESIIQKIYKVPNYNTKLNLLEYLLRVDISMHKVLIFTASKALADQLFEFLNGKFEENVGLIHSNKEQNFRFKTVIHFKNGIIKYLIASDIVARGIDISEVTHVINFDTPEIAENYIHRIGRTGRADKKGIAISFVTEKENSYILSIESLMKQTIECLPIPKEVEISNILTDDEKPKVKMKIIQIKLPKKEESGPAFHEKSDKNKKVNVRTSRKEIMKKKYGKPIKRSGRR